MLVYDVFGLKAGIGLDQKDRSKSGKTNMLGKGLGERHTH